MGYGMATNVRKKLSPKSTMYINDVNADACSRFVKELQSYGPIEIVSSAKEAATRAPILISIVPAAQHVRQVYLDKENGVIAAPKDPNRLLLESSTIDVESQREIGGAIRDAGVGSYYDAPVSVRFTKTPKSNAKLIDIGRTMGCSSRNSRHHDRVR